MNKILLEKFCSKDITDYPTYYQSLELSKFGLDWELYEYQTNALEKALKFVYSYYNKKDLLDEYYERNLGEKEFDLVFGVNEENEFFENFANYYEVDSINKKIGPTKFTNRACFWMATGSGKTLVLIKLVQLLFELVTNHHIPKKDILILAPKEEILKQIKQHVDKFNENPNFKIDLKDLREYEKVKSQRGLFDQNSVTVFYYRSDNISDVNKERLLDYRTVENNGNWYVLLDEAHKGDKEDSKRQHYYKILSRNGLLLNFSATFTDSIDIVSTVHNFNLERFINSGYGKHIKVVGEEYKSFRKHKDDEFSQNEKREIVLKSILLYCVVKKHSAEIKEEFNNDLYHNPLMLTIANEVNTVRADLKLFFEQLIEIAQGNFEIHDVLEELKADLLRNKSYQFGTEEVSTSLINTLLKLTKKDIYTYFFNASSPGSIEYTTITGERNEIAFRLKTADKKGHFAILVVSDATKWRENVLEGLDYNETPLTKSFFKEIENPDSTVNLLMGARIFTEGWDNVRPNIVNFINIGVSNEAKKFVLQAIGRGLRIQPLQNDSKYRQRLAEFNNEEEISAVNKYLNREKFTKLLESKIHTSLESLFIFATDKEVVKNILDGMEREGSADEWTTIGVFEKTPIKEELLVPMYELVDADIEDIKLVVNGNTLTQLKEVLEDETKSKILLLNLPDNLLSGSIRTINKINNNKIFEPRVGEKELRPSELFLKTHNLINHKVKKFKGFDKITTEINHYNKIQVKNFEESEVAELEKKIIDLMNSASSEKSDSDKLVSMLRDGTITEGQFKEKFSKASKEVTPVFSSSEAQFDFKYLVEHYYNPILIAKDKNSKFVKHSLSIESEIKFLEDIDKNREVFEQYDWWYFSKIDETVDQVLIPYFDTTEQRYSEFFPDFIFWLKKGNKYFIKFVDPKGREHLDNPWDKYKGFKKVFSNEKDVNVDLWFYNEVGEAANKELRERYTLDLEKIFN
jgi:superfamily II DNA or RNA helicase